MTPKKSLPGVAEAQARMLAAIAPVGVERAPFDPDLLGRVLAEPLSAERDQPPFDAAAMDGYAVAADGLGTTEISLRVVGESAAGHGWRRPVLSGEAVRIFTGAPVPPGATFVVPQENTRRDGDVVTILPRDQSGPYIRPRGGDFTKGALLIAAGQRLDPWRLGLAAAAGAGHLMVRKRPKLAFLSTGEELVRPGTAPSIDQIFDSGSPSLSAWAEQRGASASALYPAGDSLAAIIAAVSPVEADLIVTIGGASVGDHDLVKPALKTLGLELLVENVAVRPGKPVWFGVLGDGRSVLGLPGNPASALVCAELFLAPLLARLLGETAKDRIVAARTRKDLAANGPREHWMRASLDRDAQGQLHVTPFSDQDSSLLTVFSRADALLRRPADAPLAATGDAVEILELDRF